MKSILVLLVSLAPVFAFASNNVKSELAEIDAATDKCLDNPDNQNTYGMNICLNQGFEAADEVLNTLYKRIVANLKAKSGSADTDQDNAEVLSRLVKAQRAWIAYRDAQSELAGIDMLGGTGESQLIIGSLYGMTEKRALELNEMFNEAMR